jgi:hypothetical protein
MSYCGLTQHVGVHFQYCSYLEVVDIDHLQVVDKSHLLVGDRLRLVGVDNRLSHTQSCHVQRDAIGCRTRTIHVMSC